MRPILSRLFAKKRAQEKENETVTYTKQRVTQEFVMVSNGQLIPIVRDGDNYKIIEDGQVLVDSENGVNHLWKA